MEIRSEWIDSHIPYDAGMQMQQEKLQAIVDGDCPNHYYMLQHQPIYTIGRTRDQSSLGNPESLPHPYIEINRGGQGTYHGPGQLTGYPIINLRTVGNDLHKYIRALEEVLIRTLAEYDITAGRRDGLTGVWIENRKIASIGVGVRKWIAMHGYAINVTRESLRGFQAITPCGIADVSMTSVESELNQPVDIREFAQKTIKHLQEIMHEMEQEFISKKLTE